MVVSHFAATALRNHLDFSSEQGRKTSIDLLLGLVDLIDYIHSQGVVHQDITPDHILINTAGMVHLIDFHTWDPSTMVVATSDFCGWRAGSFHLPSVIENEIIESWRLVANDEIEWDSRGFGTMLGMLIPSSKAEEPFKSKLKDIVKYFTGRSDRFIGHPKSRDFVSDKLKSKLKEL